MFRRPGKNPNEKESITSLYQEEPARSPSYPYGTANKEPPPRVFEPTPAPSSPTQKSDERAWSINESWNSPKTTPLPHPFQGVQKDEEPETTLGEGVTFRGELRFE